jgi:hypothetical protein
MSGAKLTREELEAQQQAKGIVSIETVRDYMVFENPMATPEEAAFALSTRYPEYSYEVFLKSTRTMQDVKDLTETRQ